MDVWTSGDCVGEVWTKCGRSVDEVWTTCGRSVDEVWTKCGRSVDEMWNARTWCGRSVDEWLTNIRPNHYWIYIMLKITTSISNMIAVLSADVRH